nr:MAG TPA: hypothetical protein [Caudoviricetes sp.]
MCIANWKQITRLVEVLRQLIQQLFLHQVGY